MKADTQSPSNKQLIFDINPYRKTVVLVENGRASEVHVECSSERRLVGNIYRGVVQSILPGMSVAFVDIGEGKNAILHYRDMRIDRSREGGGRHEHVWLQVWERSFLQVEQRASVMRFRTQRS